MKYAIVGTGARHAMFRRAVTQTYGETNELVALCDSNDERLALSARSIPDQKGNGVATYDAADFGRMIAEQGPDKVIVTTPDYTHHEYIIAAMRAGCDVMTEKPMTTDLGRLRALLDAQKETGRSVTVTFNYRYTPARTQLKDLLMSGIIGDITAVDFRWHLDRVHGADYFRRWHRYKEKSGGLLVHKSTHHFDLMNWWVASTPRKVNALGKRSFYTPAMAFELGLGEHASAAMAARYSTGATTGSISRTMRRCASSTSRRRTRTGTCATSACLPMTSPSKTRCRCRCSTPTT